MISKTKITVIIIDWREVSRNEFKYIKKILGLVTTESHERKFLNCEIQHANVD